MKQYYAAVFVAASAVISLAPRPALARQYPDNRHVVPTHTQATPARRRPTRTYAMFARGHALAILAHLIPIRWNTQPEAPSALVKSAPWPRETGTASYYSPAYDGHRSANGSVFHERELTAAHPWLPFGTKVRVFRTDTGQSVVVTITDRLYSGRRVVDLSLAAAAELGMVRRGVAPVMLEPEHS